MSTYGVTPEELAEMATPTEIAHQRERARIRYVVLQAVRSGRLVRQPCEVCGATAVEGHHDDYSKPLDVRWLCRWHHAQEHCHEVDA